jgi:site-specific recombinase XerD
MEERSKMDREIIARYRNFMEMRGYSYTTIRNYLYIINDFAKYYKIPDEESVQEYLEKKNITKNSRATQIRIFRSLGKFMQKKYKMQFDLPEAPRMGKTLPVFLSKKEVAKLLEASKDNTRDFAIISFILYTGVRVNELVNIKTYDIDLQQNIVRVKGKGDKERIIPIAKPLSALLKKYLSERRHKGKYLFESRFNEKLTPLSVQLLVKKYAKKAHINKHITPHKLRHTFATLALESGVSPITISELLGHSSLNTTMKYTHVTNKLTEDAVSKIINSTGFEKIAREK